MNPGAGEAGVSAPDAIALFIFDSFSLRQKYAERLKRLVCQRHEKLDKKSFPNLLGPGTAWSGASEAAKNGQKRSVSRTRGVARRPLSDFSTSDFPRKTL